MAFICFKSLSQICSRGSTSPKPSAMLSLNRQLFSKGVFPHFRRYSSAAATEDVRSCLLAELKTAMKNKNKMASTTIRSVLTEVYAADKAHSAPVQNSTILTIVRKAALQRAYNAQQFEKGSRPDLAQKEHEEHALLSLFLPSLLPEAQVDQLLSQVISELKSSTTTTNLGTEPKKMLGQVLKAFYAKVDRSAIDPEVVKNRAESLTTGS